MGQFYLGSLQKISIHALRVEGDLKVLVCMSLVSYFYPRPPGGGRQRRCDFSRHYLYFYPRPPGGGRRYPVSPYNMSYAISIHALRVEGDSKNGQNFRLFLRKREKNLPL